MKHRIITMGIIAVVLLALPVMSTAQEQSTPTAIHISGTYNTTYYAGFDDWNIFPVLLPVTNMDTRQHYTLRYDLRQEGQIFGQVEGTTASGAYRIDLPAEPTASAWLDTDNDPATPSNVKVFIVGMGNGMVEESYVSRYDFMYATSFR